MSGSRCLSRLLPNVIFLSYDIPSCARLLVGRAGRCKRPIRFTMLLQAGGRSASVAFWNFLCVFVLLPWQLAFERAVFFFLLSDVEFNPL